MNIQGYTPAMNAPVQAQAASTNGTSGSSSSSNSNSNGLDSSDLQSTFLNLLVTELQNQDPTAPVDPTEMVGQMVSLNQLDQLISINQTLSSMASGTTSSTTSDSTQSAHKAAADAASAVASGTAATQPGSVAHPAATAFQPLPASASVPNSGSLMNLYGNIGASAPTSNQFTAAGGR